MIQDANEDDEQIGILMIYYCKKCNLRSDKKSTIVEHLKTCSKINEINEVTIEETDINPVKRRKFQTPPEFINKTYLESMLLCLECPQSKFYNSTELNIHQKCHSNSIGSGEDIALFCNHCGYGIGEKLDWSHLRVHLHQVHNVNFNIHCKYCQDKFQVATDYQKHLKEYHYISCSKCKFKTEYQQNFDVHFKCHIKNTKKFECYICGYSYTKLPCRWSLIAKHIIVHHPQTLIPPYLVIHFSYLNIFFNFLCHFSVQIALKAVPNYHCIINI